MYEPIVDKLTPLGSNHLEREIVCNDRDTLGGRHLRRSMAYIVLLILHFKSPLTNGDRKILHLLGVQALQ